MNHQKVLQLFALTLAFGFGAHVNATPLIDFSTDDSGYTWYGNNAGCGNGCTLGYSFNVSDDISIDGLGVYDAGSDGLNNSHEVGLWDGAGNLLASTLVGPGSTDSDASASGAGSFIWEDIGQLVLGAGLYTVGALFQVGDTDHVVFNAGGVFSNDANASYNDLAWVNSGALQLPGNTGLSDDRYFGAGIRISSVSVPEPSSIFLLSLGLFGLFASRRKS